jgi:hypothetical protein
MYVPLRHSQRGLIERHFAVWVRGKPKPGKGTVDAPLDGQACKTHYESTSYDREKDSTLVWNLLSLVTVPRFKKCTSSKFMLSACDDSAQ